MISPPTRARPFLATRLATALPFGLLSPRTRNGSLLRMRSDVGQESPPSSPLPLGSRSKSDLAVPGSPPGSPPGGEHEEEDDPNATNLELWVTLFLQLKSLAYDTRPECRSCAVTTLMTTLTTHGKLLRIDMWDDVINNILFSIYNNAIETSLGSSVQELSAELGREKGQSVQMLMHHSRNTEQKQWDETVMLSLTGIARVFRMFLGTLVSLPCFEEAWGRLLQGILSGSADSNGELANASIQAAQDLALAQSTMDGTTPKYPQLWSEIWVTYSGIVEAMHQDETQVGDSKRTVQALIESFAEVYERLRPLFSSETTQLLLRCLEKLLCCPAAQPTAAQSLLTNVQSLVLKTISGTIAPFNDVASWSLVTELLMRHHTVAVTGGGPEAGPDADSKAQKAAKCFFLSRNSVAENCLKHLLNMFRAHLSDGSPSSAEVRAQLLPQVIERLQGLSIALPRPLQAVAVKLLLDQVELGLPAYSRFCVTSPAGAERHGVEKMWQALHSTLVAMMSLHTSTAPLRPGDDAVLEPSLDVDTVQATVSHVLLHSATAPPAIRSHLVAALDGGIQDPGRDEAYNHECLVAMFTLCRRATEPEGEDTCHLLVAQEATELLVCRCSAIILDYVNDCRLSGGCPIPRRQHHQITFLLHQLLELELPPGILALPATACVQTSSAPPRERTRVHLLRLFPVLSECVGLSDPLVQQMMVKIFHCISNELGLGNTSLRACR